MLYKAIMACGAKYMMPTEASFYYREASQSLQLLTETSKIDNSLCAIIAVLLNACETIGDDFDHGHIQHTSTLVDKTDLNGNGKTLERACFWFSTLLSLVHSLYYNLPLSWDPQRLKTAMDIDLVSGEDSFGSEDQWAHRMIYICAKVTSIHFRTSQNTHEYSTDDVYRECEQYKGWCNEWANSVPRSMMPLCYIPPLDDDPTSLFPHILIVRSSAAVARLLYHTSCMLLARIESMEPASNSYNQSVQTRHALDICGIASQAEDKYDKLPQ